MITDLKFTLASFTRDKVHLNLRIFFGLDITEFSVLIAIFTCQSFKSSEKAFTKKDVCKTLKKFTGKDHYHFRGFTDNFKNLEEKGFIKIAFLGGYRSITNYYVVNNDKFNYFLAVYQIFILKETTYNNRKINDYRVPSKELQKAKKNVSQHIETLKRFAKKK